MMIRILAIGKTKAGFVADGLNEYLGRLKHYSKVSWEELDDVKKIDRTNQELVKQKEGELILSHLKPGDHLILLDEGGKPKSSTDFSKWIQKKQVSSTNMVFCIGGSFGFSEEVYGRANERLSLSSMTFNHQMVRMIFAEQLYRGFTILRGEPYHHS